MVQSGVLASCLMGGVPATGPWITYKSMLEPLMDHLLWTMLFGMNGAATAALGEMAVGFFVPAATFGERKEGVKLGESTLRVFLVVLDPRQPIVHTSGFPSDHELVCMGAIDDWRFVHTVTEGAAYTPSVDHSFFPRQR